jgi:DNA-binding transcriptional LysR family regulator
MELRQLRHFVAVIECGNLSRASRKVHISQPALTRSIKALEDQLKARLLDRKPRGVVPTPAGDVFFQHAKLILNECQRAKLEISDVESGAVGQVNIGIGAMFSEFIIDDVIARMTEDHPKLHITVTEGFFEELVDQLRDGRIDAIFANFPLVTASSDLALEPLMTVTSEIMVSARHALTRKRKIIPADLSDAKWVVVNQPHMADSLDQLFSKSGLSLPASTVRTNSLGLIKALVLRRGFISFIPKHLVTSEIKRGELTILKLLQGHIERRAGLITRSGAQLRPAVTHVLAEIRKYCIAASSHR